MNVVDELLKRGYERESIFYMLKYGYDIEELLGQEKNTVDCETGTGEEEEDVLQQRADSCPIDYDEDPQGWLDYVV